MRQEKHIQHGKPSVSTCWEPLSLVRWEAKPIVSELYERDPCFRVEQHNCAVCVLCLENETRLSERAAEALEVNLKDHFAL